MEEQHKDNGKVFYAQRYCIICRTMPMTRRQKISAQTECCGRIVSSMVSLIFFVSALLVLDSVDGWRAPRMQQGWRKFWSEQTFTVAQSIVVKAIRPRNNSKESLLRLVHKGSDSRTEYSALFERLYQGNRTSNLFDARYHRPSETFLATSK